MQREYFCAYCGLYFWQEYRLGLAKCADLNCNSHNGANGISVYACDTTGFFYLVKHNKDVIKRMGWSSPKFANKYAIEHYRKQGIVIK